MPKRTIRSSKPSVAIIGAGRLGQALAIALSSKGYPIKALVARHRAKAEKAARLVGGTSVISLGASQLNILPAADLLLITTPDDAIEQIASNLAAALVKSGTGLTGTAGVSPAMSAKRENRPVILHTSGALSSQALRPLTALGLAPGSLHPL